MQRLLYRSIILFFLLLNFAGCGKDNPASPQTYSDSLTLGTGRKGNALTGETTVFPGNNPTIYWRVESSEKFNGSNAEILIEKSGDFGWETAYNTIYQYIEPDSYVAISSYYHMSGPGKFRASGFVSKNRRLTGVVEFTVLEAGK